MAYKIGDKFVIEIDSVMTNKNGTSYGIKGFEPLLLKEYDLERLERIPGKFEYRVGDEVYWTGNPNYIGVITFVEDRRACILFRDGKAWDATRESTEEPFQGISKTGFVDHRIIEWVSES
jgi:hypothetical protein